MARAPRPILVVEDNPITLKMLRAVLEAGQFSVLEASDGRTALEFLETEHPAIVVHDFVLPDMNGIELVQRIRAHPQGRDLPTILVSGLASRTDQLRASGLFTAVFSKPVEGSLLVETVRGLLLEHEPPSPALRLRRILVVDDDPTNLKLARVQLGRAGHEVTTASSAEEALAEARRSRPDVILADVLMPGLDGFQLCLAVRRDPELAELPIVLVSSAYNEEADRRLALKTGAADLVLRTPGFEMAMQAIERALHPDAAPPAPSGLALEQEYLTTLRRQVDRQLAHNEQLAKRSAIQTSVLSMIGALTHALARPQEVPSILGDILVHSLDAVGISTGILYARKPGGALQLHAMAGLPDVRRADVERAFGHPELLEPAPDAQPKTLSSDTAGDPAVRAFLSRFKRHFALIVPFVVLGRHHGSLVLGSDTHDFTEASWQGFGRVLAAQFGQALALGQARAELAESEDLTWRAFDASPNGMITIDEAGRIIMANRQTERIFGYTEAELVGRPIDDLLPERQRTAHLNERALFFARPEARVMGAGRDLFGLHKSGHEIPVEVGLAPVQRGDEQFVIASVIDITERKRTQQTLAESAGRIQALMDNANDGISIISPDGVILDTNGRMGQIFGLAKEQIIGHRLEEFLRPETAADRMREFGEMVQRGRGQVSRVEFRRPDGGLTFVDFNLSVAEIGGQLAVISIGRDVTEQHSLEQQLRQAQKMEAVGRLAGGVAHDFNNVLTAIFGYTDLLTEEFPPESEAGQDLAEIRAAAERAAALTRQLLAFSRRQVLEPVMLSPNDLVRDLEKMLRRLIGEDVEFRLELDPDTGNVRADPGQLEQVIINLVVNARDAMPTGGKVLIETMNADLVADSVGQQAAISAGEYVRIAIRDTGTGIDPAIQARIFEPFFTTKPAGKGTGLGLSTALGIVQQSGGHIHVDSEPGRGSTFEVYLPRVGAPVEPAAARARATTLSGTETVLLAEDDPMLRPLVKELLRKLGYTVLEAGNAQDALEVARRHSGPIHLLITDVVMPGMSGRQLGGQLTRERPEVRVLYMSGYTDDAIAHHGVVDVGLAFLQKPFAAADLARKVREVLDAPAQSTRTA